MLNPHLENALQSRNLNLFIGSSSASQSPMPCTNGLDDWLVADCFHAVRALPALAFAAEVACAHSPLRRVSGVA